MVLVALWFNITMFLLQIFLIKHQLCPNTLINTTECFNSKLKFDLKKIEARKTRSTALLAFLGGIITINNFGRSYNFVIVYAYSLCIA